MEEKKKDNRLKQILKDNLLIILMILAVIIGVSMGLGLRSNIDTTDKRKIFYLKFPGDLLLNMLKMLILPLIVSSLISSMSGLKAQASGKMGLRTVVYYLTTTFCAVVLGIVLVVLIRPGERGSSDIQRSGKAKSAEALDALFDLIRNCFPPNLIQACFQKQVTETTYVNKTMTTAKSNMTMNMTTMPTTDATTADDMNETTTAAMISVTKQKLDSIYVNQAGSGMNVLGLVVFSLFFGGVLARMESKGKPLVDLFDCLHLATMKLIILVIWYAPLGIIFLIAAKLVEMKNPDQMFMQLGYYMLTVLIGLAIHGFLILPLVYFVFTRKNPYSYLYGMLKALLTAWGTASSSATLPVTMQCLEDKNHVDSRVTMFVTPIGATINMDGTALYEAVAAIFIAQYLNVDMDFGKIVVISLTSTAAAIGAAGVPSAGLVTMTIVLSAVGLPIDEVTLILSIDWLLDRFRTAINVLGDAYGAGIVEHLSRADLEAMDEELPLEKKYQVNGKDTGEINETFTTDDSSTKM